MNMIKIMRFTILEESISTLPKSLFYNYYSQIKWIQIKSNVGFSWEGKTGVPRENSHGRVENQQTQSTWHPVQKSNRGHIGGRQVLSQLGQPCRLKLQSIYTKFGLKQADVIQHFSYCITDLQKTDVVLSTECLNKLHVHCLLSLIHIWRCRRS